MKSLLIIGGTGFFGKSILDVFKQGGLEIYGINKIKIMARRVEGFTSMYPELINENVQLLASDVSNCNFLPYADIVIHAASSADARDYINDAKGQRNNIESATSNYCFLAKDYHRNSKIVYCSSGAVYGQQPCEIESMSEDFPFQGLSDLVERKRDYALGKRSSEKAIQDLGVEGLTVSIARCFAFYGKYLPKDQHYAYGNFLRAAEQGNTIEVHSKHRVIRSYMYADDLVHALIKVALDANPGCPIYNVGSDIATDIRDLAAQIGHQYDVPVSIAKIENDEIDRYVPNIKRLKELNSRTGSI
jgi:dTDP-glucose 4,6-dehydratase